MHDGQFDRLNEVESLLSIELSFRWIIQVSIWPELASEPVLFTNNVQPIFICTLVLKQNIYSTTITT